MSITGGSGRKYKKWKKHCCGTLPVRSTHKYVDANTSTQTHCPKTILYINSIVLSSSVSCMRLYFQLSSCVGVMMRSTCRPTTTQPVRASNRWLFVDRGLFLRSTWVLVGLLVDKRPDTSLFNGVWKQRSRPESTQARMRNAHSGLPSECSMLAVLVLLLEVAL